MKSFGSYISKYLVSFVAFILILLFLNAVVFGLTFQKIVTEDYGDSSPQAMLEMTAPRLSLLPDREPGGDQHAIK